MREKLREHPTIQPIQSGAGMNKESVIKSILIGVGATVLFYLAACFVEWEVISLAAKDSYFLRFGLVAWFLSYFIFAMNAYIEDEYE